MLIHVFVRQQYTAACFVHHVKVRLSLHMVERDICVSQGACPSEQTYPELGEEEEDPGLSWLAYQGTKPMLVSQSILFQLMVSQSSWTIPLVSPELAFQAHQNTFATLLCSPSFPSPEQHRTVLYLPVYLPVVIV